MPSDIWPLASHFGTILQNPQIAFRDPMLKQVQIVKNVLGQPKVWAGPFANVYQGVFPDGTTRAIRVFTSHWPGRSEHYRAVAEYLRHHRLKSLVEFTYSDDGIRSAGDGKWYPLLTMEWVAGQTLYDAVRRICQQRERSALSQLAEYWLELVDELARHRIAHGDLNHSNVLVTEGGRLKLVDYDCMSVPALYGRNNPELGVEPYQHPGRNSGTPLSPELDNFPALFIFVMLRGLAAAPELWDQYIERPQYDKLLMRREDLEDPQGSPLIAELLRSPDAEVRRLCRRLVELWRGPIDGVPPLRELVFSLDTVTSLLDHRDFDAALELLTRSGPSTRVPPELEPRIHEARERVAARLALEGAAEAGDEMGMRRLYRPDLLDDYPRAQAAVATARLAAQVLPILQRLEVAERNNAWRELVAVWDSHQNLLAQRRSARRFVADVRTWRARNQACDALLALLRQPDSRAAELTAAWDRLMQQGGHPEAEPHRARVQNLVRRETAWEAFQRLAPSASEQGDRELVNHWVEALFADWKPAETARPRVSQARQRLETVGHLRSAVQAGDAERIAEILEGPLLAGYSFADDLRRGAEKALRENASARRLLAALPRGDRDEFLRCFDSRLIRRAPKLFAPHQATLRERMANEILRPHQMALRRLLTAPALEPDRNVENAFRVRWHWPEPRFTDRCILAICESIPPDGVDPHQLPVRFRQPVTRRMYEDGGGSLLLHARSEWADGCVAVWAELDVGFGVFHSHPLVLGQVESRLAASSKQAPRAAEYLESEFVAGERLGPFTIRRQLARGTAVATLEVADDQGALHHALVRVGGDPSAAAALDGLRAIQQLVHPSLARILHVGEPCTQSCGNIWCVREALPPSVETAWQGSARAPSTQLALVVGFALCDLLSFLHGLPTPGSNPVIHGFLAPSEIHVLPDHAVKVSGLELQYLLTPASKFDSWPKRQAYRSPEHFGIDRQARTESDDLWAVASIMYFLAVGEPLIHVGDRAAVSWAHKNRLPQAMVGQLEDPRLRRVLMRALAHDPGERYLTADEFRGAIGAVLPPAERQVPPVLKTRWHLSLETGPAHRLAVGQELVAVLHLSPVERPGSVELHVPQNALELTIYIEAPGFQLTSDHLLTLPVADTPVARQLAVSLIAISSGLQSLQFQVHAGSRNTGVAPAMVQATVEVAAPVVLPEIRELIDRRAIPDPQPDVMLYVGLEETPTGQQIVYHLTCPLLGLDRERLDPPLTLTSRDALALRRFAIRAASDTSDASPCDMLAALRACGMALFDKLLPRGHRLRQLYWRIAALAQASEAAWSWLVISDADALLPWEIVCAYRQPRGVAQPWYDEFFAAKFVLAHWLGRRGFSLPADAPLGRLDLAHYSQRPARLPGWQRALGGEDLVGVEGSAGHLALTSARSPYFGLHVLRYADRARAGRVTFKLDKPVATDAGVVGAAAAIGESRLDFTLKRPVAALSLVDDRPDAMTPESEEAALEAGWVLPFLHAGASAVVGPRWYVSPASDQVFAAMFYRQIRTGADLGWAVWRARSELRQARPHCGEWLAYAYFGHPCCQPYLVKSAQGFTLFESLDQEDGQAFQAGGKYRFRASYRAEAPAWYTGRLRLQQAPLDGDSVSVLVAPLADGCVAQTWTLNPVPGGDSFQRVVILEMPGVETTLPVLVRFQKGNKELRSIMLNLQVEERKLP